jgi:phosphoribosyl 1,2-cyclic phosphodiesterase
VKYGGNTSCVEIRAEDRLIVLDAGTGIRLLGKTLQADSGKAAREITLLLTHTHWDHIQGLPFFLPQLRPGSLLRIIGCEGARERLATLLVRQMESPFFPVPLRGTPASIDIVELTESEFQIGGVIGHTLEANHPGACVGYKLVSKQGSIAFFPDNESFLGKLRASGLGVSKEEAQKARKGHQAMVDFIRDVDLLVMDSQYDREEYTRHIGWGHGCVDDVVAMAAEAGARRLVLFHHDPDHSDSKIDAMSRTARQLARKAGSKMKVEAAREGSTISIGGA